MCLCEPVSRLPPRTSPVASWPRQLHEVHRDRRSPGMGNQRIINEVNMAACSKQWGISRLAPAQDFQLFATRYVRAGDRDRAAV